MRDTAGSPPGAVRDAAQPSLWDRLVNDLPGVSAEIEDLRHDLLADLGEERLAGLLAGGPRAIQADTGLTPIDHGRFGRLARLETRHAALSTRGIVVSPEMLREAVRRDLEMLFSTQRYETAPPTAPDSPTEHDLADYPQVRRSVLNYGIPAFAGRAARDFDREILARELKAILAVFEPRLRENATRVTVSIADKTGGLVIEIDGLLMMTPVSERLRLRTTIDLESGRARTSLGDA